MLVMTIPEKINGHKNKTNKVEKIMKGETRTTQMMPEVTPMIIKIQQTLHYS